jgi:hypothetical protein
MITDQQVDRAVEAYRFSITKCERPEKWEAGVGHVEAIRAALEAAEEAPVHTILFIGSEESARDFAWERGLDFGRRGSGVSVYPAKPDSAFVMSYQKKGCRYYISGKIGSSDRELLHFLVARGIKEFDPAEIQ